MAENAEFETTSSDSKRLPHFQNPLSGHGRVENVFCICCEKKVSINFNLPLNEMAASFGLSLSILKHFSPTKSISEIAESVGQDLGIPLEQSVML